MEKVIEISGLSFGFDKKLILDNLDLTVDKGDFLGIVGPNGSGKSTLIKLLLKNLTPLGGEIKILGDKIEKFKNWDRIGYISQKSNSFNTSFPATVEEVVGANLFSKVGLFRRLNRQHREKIHLALETVGMQDCRDRLIGNLSGGQQQRVFIARLLVNEPDIMIMDEPTVGIDAKSEEVVYCLLARLNKELGITVIIVTHDISAVTVHANKLGCMGNKKMIIHDTSEKLSEECITDLYNYGVQLHVHKHDCENCSRRNAG